MVASSFDYHAPTSVADALALLDQHGEDAKLLAGGHSLIPLMKTRLSEPSVLIDLGKISTLSYINEQDGGLAIGALTTYSEIAASALVQSNAPVLADASGQVADNQVRNRGTIGGSLSHADPAGDLPAVALALGAELKTSSSGAHRTISADDFFVDLLTTALAPNEILSEIAIPALPAGTGTAYVKFANKASRYAVVGVAAVVTVGSDGSCQSVRIAITGAGAKATRAAGTEAALVGSNLDDAAIQAAASQAGEGIEFNQDVHASAEYRAHLTTVYAGRAIRAAVENAS
ncbi:MAG: xanthine dehydrogenase family protein subunit M [SAR202 cluster bacterium]|jgi:carbon-monoxide dehydrogenase medium subunit|nr:xanthine dehydrogenase family protein subunit M [SAR202 cluster bacterium]MDP6714345.1 xanthine dehydrogenase family protein subunit M [SAR202 cluster bacterium]